MLNAHSRVFTLQITWCKILCSETQTLLASAYLPSWMLRIIYACESCICYDSEHIYVSVCFSHFQSTYVRVNVLNARTFVPLM